MPSLSHRRAFRVRSFSAAVACTASLSLFGSSAFAQATPKDSLQPAVADLISTITESESELNDLDLRIGELREAVNEALLILQDARSEAAQAKLGVSSAKAELDVAQADIADAQDELDELSRAKYRRAAGSPGMAEISSGDRRDDELFRKSFLRAQTDDKLAVIDELDRVRTEKANKESQLRKTHELANQRAESASDAESQARALLERTTAEVAQLQQEREQLAQEHKETKQELAAARGNGATGPNEQSSNDSQSGGNKSRTDSNNDSQGRSDGTQVNSADAAPSSVSETESNRHTTTESRNTANTTADEQGSESTAAGSNEPISDELTELIEQAANTVAEHLPDHTALELNETATNQASQTAQDPPNSIPALQRVEVTAADTTTGSDAEVEGEATSAESQVDSAQEDAAASQQNSTSNSTGADSSASSAGSDAAAQNSVAGGDLADELSGVLEELDTNASVTKDASANFAEVGPSQQAQAVLSRARSQLGVDYAWGGGNAQGPTAGIRDGANADMNGDYGKVGFDCSGLVQYAFAGAGISLPHYSGGQYRHGTHVSTSDLQPGDLIFYGPGGSQHVAIYSGNGMMIEAPHSGSQVREVPVRHSGMTEYAVRLLG